MVHRARTGPRPRTLRAGAVCLLAGVLLIGCPDSRGIPEAETTGIPGDTELTPGGGLVAWGPRGGPFTLPVQDFVLTNKSGDDLDLELLTTDDWVTPSVTAPGPLAPAQSTRFTLSLDEANLANFEAGNYLTSVAVLNRATGSVVRTFNVEVNIAERDPAGWTEFTPSADTRIVYVSPSGANSNDGLSPATAKRSIDAGMSLLRDGFPDWVLFEKGGTWNGMMDLTKSGRSSKEPMLISSYGTGPRPIIRSPSDGIGSYNGGVEHVAVVGLELTAQSYDGSVGSPVGVFLLGWFNDLLFEDLYIHNYAGGFVAQNPGADQANYLSNIQLRRSVIERVYTTQSNHSQGIYAEGVDGMLVEECVFYRCGFDEDVPGSDPTIFRHACYFQNSTRNITAQRNITLETSSHGYQFRGSNTFAKDNFLARVAIAILVGRGDDPDLTPDGGASGVIEDNVILYARDISPAHPRGIGLSAGNLLWGVVRGNLFAHSRVSHEVGATMSFGRTNNFGDIGINNLTIEKNIFYNWLARLISDDESGSVGFYTNVSFLDNQVQSLLPRVNPPWILSMDASHAAPWTSGGNKFFDANEASRGFTVGSSQSALPGWRTQVGDTSSTREQLPYPDPDRSPERYVDHIEQLPPGTSGFDDFVSKVLAQSRDSWNPNYTAGQLNAWIRDGFELPSPPIRPSNLVATVRSDSEIDLSWADNADDEDGFSIERSPDAVSWSQIDSVGADVTSYQDSGLDPETPYYYRVLAFNAIGSSAYSNSHAAATLPPLPNAPTGLNASVISSSQVDLSWTDNSDNEEGFDIERSLDGLSWVRISSVGPDVTTFPDSGLAPRTEYRYRIAAYNSGGRSAFSNIEIVSTIPGPPGNPTDLSATAISASQIDLVWVDNSVTEDGFRIERSPDKDLWEEVGSVGRDVTSYSDVGLDPLTEYFYQIRAYNVGGAAYSEVAGATTLPLTPLKPSDLTATTVSSSGIDLSWTDNSRNELGFAIRRSLDGFNWVVVDSVGTDVTSYADRGLSPETEYFYRVRAYNGAGISGNTNLVTATTFPPPPADPTGLAATAISPSQIDLSWTDNADNEDNVEIDRSPDGSTWALLDTIGPDSTGYSDISLAPQTSYSYRVRAVNAGGGSGYSNAVTTTTLPLAPSGPTNVVAAAVSSSRIDFTWNDNSNNEDGFHIRRSRDGVNWTLIANLGANVTAYSDRGLQPDTEHFYRVRAYNITGNSPFSDIGSATTLPLPPASPTSLGAAVISANRIDLSWTDNAVNEDGVGIERSLDSVSWAQIDSVGADATSYSDTALAERVEYFYRVRAFNLGGVSGYSNVVSDTTPATIPTDPSNLVATSVSSTQIDLNWTDNAGNEDGYVVRRLAPGEEWIRIDTLASDETSYSDSDLNPDTEYSYRVRAFNPAGNSGMSNIATATTFLAPPEDPTNLQTSPTSISQIDLSWSDNAGNEDGYEIERSPDGLSWVRIDTVGADISGYSDTGLLENTQYSYRVRAFHATATSGYSNVSSVATLLSLPGDPSNLQAVTVSQNRIDLSWTDNAYNEDGFQVERSPDGGSWNQIDTTAAGVTAYSDLSLAADTEYFYRVRAFNAAGGSGNSAAVSATTLPTPPAVPTGLTATAVSVSRIDLGWTDNADNEDRFEIERSVDGTTWVQLDSVGPDTTTYSDPGLSPETEYFYRIGAINRGGQSYSGVAGATTHPPRPTAPSDLVASPVSSSQIDIAWTDNSHNEEGFDIRRSLNGVNWVVFDTVAADVTSYSDPGLDPDTEYFYRVRAYNITGISANTNLATATTLPAPPADPTGLVATAISSGQIDLSWVDNAGTEDGFDIEKSLDGVAWSLLGSVAADVTSYSDNELGPETQAFYRVKAFNLGGSSGYSNVADATTLPIAPAAPSDLTATVISSSQIDLTWTDNADNESRFEIERSVDGSTWVQFNSVASDETAYSDIGLSPDTDYFYRIGAVNVAGIAYSEVIQATTLPTLPAGPTGLGATAISSGRIDLGWTDNADNEDGFYIEGSPDGVSWTQIDSVGPDVTTYSDLGLTPETETFYRVRAFNLGGSSGYSNVASATTPPTLPTPPSDLTASVISSSQIDLAWTDNSNNENGFDIRRSLNGTNWVVYDSVGVNVTSYSDTGLDPETEYFYRVRAHNLAGNSGNTNLARATTLPAPPADPTGLGATVISSSQIDLSWTDNSNSEDGFQIEGSPDGVSWAQIASVGPDVTVHSDLGLAPETETFYRVRAFNLGGSSGYSNVASATTLPALPAPPTGLSATAISSSRIDLAWTDNSDNETRFDIRRSLDGSNWVVFDSVGVNVTSYSDTGLDPDTEYFYRVRAHNLAGNSGNTNLATATTLPAPPTDPSGLGATAISSSQIDLSWTDNADDEDGFQIDGSPDGVSWAQIDTVGPDVTSYSDLGLAPETETFYRVRAFNLGGSSGYSNVASATTFQVPPAAPSGLIATALSSSQIDLAWTDNSDNENGFDIRRSLDGSNWVVYDSVGANVTSYSDTGLDPDTEYFYRVRAHNLAGNSSNTNRASATTLSSPPAAPTGLGATAISSSQIDLAWTDNADDEDGYSIEGSPDGVGWAQIATVGPDVTVYSDLGLASETEVFYRVSAFNAGGNSGYSNVVSATTFLAPPAPPSGLIATALSSSQIYLVWTDNADNEDGFRIEQSPDGASWVEIDTVGAGVTSYPNRVLTPDTRYFYRVRAFNGAGSSAYSNTASATTRPTPPVAPTGLGATAVAGDQIDLSWTDNSDNEDGFFIERSLDALNWVQVGTAGVDETSHSDLGLSGSTQYFYRVRSFNVSGSSVYTNVANATTQLFPPSAPLTDSVNVYHDASVESDDLESTWAADDTGYIPMPTVTETSEDSSDRSCVLPSSTSGAVYIRIRETHQGPGTLSIIN